MVNHVGKTTEKLSTNLGETRVFTSADSITIIAGEIGRGMLLFDPVGTLGVISSYTNPTEFAVTTCALSLDIQTILSLEY